MVLLFYIPLKNLKLEENKVKYIIKWKIKKQIL